MASKETAYRVKGGFTLDDLAKHMKMSPRLMRQHLKASGVKRRVREYHESGHPEYVKFTSQEAELILREAWAYKGRAQARKMGVL